MYNEKDTINLYKMAKKLAEMVGTNAQNILKLGKVVETNTDNLNLLATRVLKLEQKLNVALKAIERLDDEK
jgi:cobalamin biosynthesis protein CobD/CbiB